MSGFLDFLRAQRGELDAWLTERNRAHTFSLTSYVVDRGVGRLIDQHVTGRCLDAGSGRAPYKARLEERGVEVLTIDIENRSGDVDIIGDLQNMPAVASASVDAVICTEVLEHVPDPAAALGEIERVLRPGGVLVLSVPHLSPIHEAPHDFYRYTCFGLSHLLSKAGLEVLELSPAGGLFAFLGHGLSQMFFTTTSVLRPLRPVAWALNYAFLVRLLDAVDRAVGLSSIYASNWVVLAKKRARP
jgi:SAM-dependent methyltransferase